MAAYSAEGDRVEVSLVGDGEVHVPRVNIQGHEALRVKI
jgi:hypothetical protein